jgi:isochorismate synthase
MNKLLCTLLAATKLTDKLRVLANDAPGSALVSHTLDLGTACEDWLAYLPANASYWYRAQPAQSEFRLGIGHALHVSSDGPQRFAALANAYAGLTHDWRHDGQALAFCGFAFAAQTSNNELPAALLAVPSILLESINGRCRMTLSSTVDHLGEAPSHWAQLLNQSASIQTAQHFSEAERTLAERAWVARVNAAKRGISQGRIDKVVLARSRKLLAGAPISAHQLLETLPEQQPDACIYAFRQGGSTFLGATPERLIHLAGRQIESDALAGTAWPGSGELAGSKNQHEQSLVVQAIMQALEPLCVLPPNAMPVEVHAAGQLTHLRNRITGQILNGVSLFDLIRALHPTPAVGGYPTNAALNWLAEHKEQRSGWYSGGIGMLDGAGNGEFSVALRSALIQGKSIELHAGAGIVADSDPWQELAETNAKLGTLLDALHKKRNQPQRKEQ